MFEIAKEGYRESFNSTGFPLGSYQETFDPDFVLHKFKVRPFNESEEFRALMIGNPTVLFSHFVGGNIMHSFHDDWLPLLFTIAGTEEFLEENNGAKRLLLSLSHFGTKYEDMFKWLGKFFHINKFIDSLKLENIDNLTHLCFADGLVGLSTSAQWYQYGMRKHEGPVPALNKEFAGENIKEAIRWIKNGLNIPDDTETKNKSITVITRKSNRLILNENELLEKLKAAFPEYENVQFLSEEAVPSVAEMIKVVHNSSVLIGMHGALMILSMFLPQTENSKVVELFFFGVDPNNYTPYKTLSDLIGIQYRTWSNPREEAPYNIAHDDRPFHQGGIKHLPASQQHAVKWTKMVPKHKCCYFPMWKYRLFQDTHVDVEAVINLIKE